jgi:photosystem II stability/assembly factor-like uncharacterized protein
VTARRTAARVLATLALVAAVLSGCTSGSGGVRTSSAGSAPASPTDTAADATSPATPGSSGASPAPVSTGGQSPSSRPSHRLTPPPSSGPLNGLQVADATFVGHLGWALGTVGCANGSGRCSAIARSTDDGRSWRSVVAPRMNVAIEGLDDIGGSDCAAPCIEHIRFATPAVGYLFGDGRNGGFFLTTDGGSHWRRQPGGAAALESLDGTVIRIDAPGCDPPGCRYRAEVASIGGTRWQAVPLGGARAQNFMTTGAVLARTGSAAYVLVLNHPAGGGQSAHSVLFASSDDGRHWSNRGEPCPQGPGEVDATALSTAPDGSAAVLCRSRGADSQFVAVRAVGQGAFRAGSRDALGAAPVGALAAASRSVVLVSSDDTYRSSDGGRHFRRLSANGDGSPGALGWLGFASPTVGHGISVDRRTLWTTADAGRTWHAGRLR